MKLALLLNLALVFNANGQLEDLNFWNLGRASRGEGDAFYCVREGYNFMTGLVPDFEDMWFLIPSCDSYLGSSSCQNEEYNDFVGKLVGNCACNQLEYQEDIDIDSPCLGKVGAVCTAEATTFIPEKKCIENAKCVPDQGEGYTVGHCTCLGGYEVDGNRMCVADGGEKEPPRTTTTTEAPERGEIPLPLDLLLGLRWVPYGESCAVESRLLNKTYCNTEGLTVSCLNHLDENNVSSTRCQCNLEEDSIFDEELNTCVSLAGGWCNVRKNWLGWKICAEGSDCFLPEGQELEDNSFGQCECLYGYKEEANGLCTRDPNIPNPSTKRPIITFPARTTVPGETEPPVTGETGSPSTGEPGPSTVPGESDPPSSSPTTPGSASTINLGAIMALFIPLIYLVI